MKQKVCHLTAVHPSFDIRIFYKQCVSLRNFGYEVNLIAPINAELNKYGVRVLPLRLPKNRLLRMLIGSFKMSFFALKTKSSLYHFHDPELMFCGIILKCFGKKVIFDVHENVRLSIVSKDWIPNFLKPLIGFVYFLLERMALFFYDALILAEDSYKKYYPNKKSIVVLNYPLPIDNNSEAKNFNEPINFVYAGGVSKNRGLWEMVYLVENLLSENVACILTIIGQIYNKEEQLQLKIYLSEHNLDKKIIIVGRVDFEALRTYYERADIGLIFLKPIENYLESLPTKMFEYMQFGLPILSCNFPLYKKYINESKTGKCINLDNINGELQGIISLLKDKEALKRMQENGYYAIKTKYNWYSEEEKLIHIYQKVLN